MEVGGLVARLACPAENGEVLIGGEGGIFSDRVTAVSVHEAEVDYAETAVIWEGLEIH